MSLISRRLVWALRLLALGVIGLNLAAPNFSEATAWGLWPMTYLPAGWRWGLGLAATLLVFGGEWAWRRVGPALIAAVDRLPLNTRAMHLLLALLAAVPFVLFRIRHLRWGDAYIFFVAIPRPDIRLTYVWQAPLDVFIHAKAWQMGNRLFGWPDPLPVYTIISALCGVAFVWVLLRLATWLGRNRTERVLTVGLVLTLGMLELFFGYIENYSIIAVGVLLYVWLALRTVRGELDSIWPAMVLALTHATHPATIILAPSLLYLAWLQGGKDAEAQGNGGARARGVWRALIRMAVPYVLVFAGVVALMSGGSHGLDALLGVDFPGGGDRRWLVPLFHTTTKWEHYTLFSLGHLIDIVNEQLLVAPVIVPGLALTALCARPRLPRRDPAWRLLALITGLYFLLTLTWNPDYGGQRDWDLFSGPAVPATLWLAYSLPRALPERPALRQAGWALSAAQAYHLVAWLYQNTLPLPR